jgi:signal transduction histidine kinase
MVRVLNRVLRHNLRNDMNVISGYAGILADRLDGEDATLADRIVETSDRLGELAETARTLEENWRAPAELRPEDVGPAVTRAAERVAERYPDASVDVEVPETAVALSAPRLETAISELLDNAAKHAGDQPSVGIDVTTTGTAVEIAVWDDGPGLPDQEHPVLTAGEETPLVHGSGLGLWLVYWIVESMEGSLRIGDVDDGTRIEIRLQKSHET